MTYQFIKDPISGMILVYVRLDETHEFKMALDTGASRTTFDINALCLVEYPIMNKITENGMVETANGIIEIGVFKANSLSAFDHTKHDLPVQVYDFLAHGIISDYDGVLGLDFFENTKFCIDMIEQTVEIKNKKNKK